MPRAAAEGAAEEAAGETDPEVLAEAGRSAVDVDKGAGDLTRELMEPLRGCACDELAVVDDADASAECVGGVYSGLRGEVTAAAAPPAALAFGCGDGSGDAMRGRGEGVSSTAACEFGVRSRDVLLLLRGILLLAAAADIRLARVGRTTGCDGAEVGRRASSSSCSSSASFCASSDCGGCAS